MCECVTTVQVMVREYLFFAFDVVAPNVWEACMCVKRCNMAVDKLIIGVSCERLCGRFVRLWNCVSFVFSM